MSIDRNAGTPRTADDDTPSEGAVYSSEVRVMTKPLPPPKLVASYWTLAGCSPGEGTGQSRFGFAERVVAAGKAGFSGMGLLDADLQHVLKTSCLSDCKKILDDNGITHVELEFLLDWFLEGERRRVSDQQRRFLFEACEALTPHLIKVGDFSRSVCPMPRLIEAFAQLCAEAADRNTRIAFEPMGSALIRDLESALELVSGASAPNGGLAIDIWHMVNLGVPFAEVSKIPKRYLQCVDLNDAAVDPDSESNPSDQRGFCGEGSLPVKAFIESIRKTGFDGPWGVEIFSEEHARLPLDEAASRAVRTTLAQFT